MIARSGLDDVALNGCTVEHNSGNAALLAVRILDGDVERGIAQHTVYCILLER